MRRRRESGGGPREISEVNIVPLADVSLVLLIILMVISPMMARTAWKVKSAAAATGPEEPAPPPSSELVLTVGLHEKGYSLGGRFFEEETGMMTFLSEELSRREDRKVFVLPDPDVTHGRVLELLERLSGGGAESVALVETDEGLPPEEGPR